MTNIYQPIVSWSEIMPKSAAVTISDVIFINIYWIWEPCLKDEIDFGELLILAGKYPFYIMMVMWL